MFRQYFPQLNNHFKNRYYFDNAATTQISQTAFDTLDYYLKLPQSNPARGLYTESEQITQLYEQARQSVASVLNVNNNEIIFTSGTTHGINSIAQMLCNSLKKGANVLISEAEHHSNYLPWLKWSKYYGQNISKLTINENAEIDLTQLDNFRNIDLLAITHCSNVTGQIIDLQKISLWCKKNNCKLVVDGAQTIQHFIPDLKQLKVDAYNFSGHKMFASTGAGVMYISKTLDKQLRPFLVGGGMFSNFNNQHHFQWKNSPAKYEAGTPAYIQCITLAETLVWLKALQKNTDWHKHNDFLLNYFDEQIKSLDFIDYINQKVKYKIPIFSFNFKNLHSHDVAQLLSQMGFCIRSGKHCTQPLFDALNLHSSNRVSLCCYNNKEEIDQFVSALKNIYEHTKHW